MPQPRPPASPDAANGAVEEGQSHPLHSVDRATVDRLLAATAPEEADLVDAARLLSRYRGFPGAFDLQDDLARAIRLWGLSEEALRDRARALWQGGWRPGAKTAVAEPVGSGFDASGDGET